jgi:hypothetical protein
LAIATVDFIASFWLFNQVKAKFVVMPFVIMALLDCQGYFQSFDKSAKASLNEKLRRLSSLCRL